MRRRSGVLVATLALVGAAPVAVSSAAAADGQGSWQVTTQPSPVRAAHAALLNNGKVLLVAGSGNSRGSFDAGSFRTSIWDPATDTFQTVGTPWDAFCSGHAFLPDGRLLVAGGSSAYPGPATNNSNAGVKDAYLFDPATSSYQRAADQSHARWYPTLTELGDGRIFTVGGLDEVGLLTKHWQIFDGDTGRWTAPTLPPDQFAMMPMYPALHLMRDGRLFYSGVNTFGGSTAVAPAGIWDVTTNRYQVVPGLTDDGLRDQGMSVLLPPAQDQKVMVVGGGHQDYPAPAVASTAIVDLTQPNPQFTPGPPIDAGKMYVSATILPDKTVLQTGGASTTIHNGTNPVFSTQIYNPKTSTWRKVGSHSVPRVYHSSALLLPDGRVATFGGNPVDSFEMRIEVYTPPYLQTGTARPTIASASTEIHYGATYSVASTQAAPIASAVLVLPAAVTHSSDPNQRLVDLPFTATAGGVSVSVPNEPNLAPPGWYMMYLVDANGVPSVAHWVHLTEGSYPSGGYTLEGWGGMHPFATDGVAAPAVTQGPYWYGWDIARGAALQADHRGGYIADGWGGVHPFATGGVSLPSRVKGNAYWPGWDIVRGVAMLPNGTGGYVLDGWGGLHPFRVGDGAAPPAVHGAPYWSGWDVARGIAILPDGTGGYVVDALGAVHPFSLGHGPMPPPVPPPYRPWAAPVRGIAVQQNGSGGMVLDGWGGRHSFPIGTGAPVSPSGGASWVGWSIARGVTL